MQSRHDHERWLTNSINKGSLLARVQEHAKAGRFRRKAVRYILAEQVRRVGKAKWEQRMCILAGNVVIVPLGKLERLCLNMWRNTGKLQWTSSTESVLQPNWTDHHLFTACTRSSFQRNMIQQHFVRSPSLREKLSDQYAGVELATGKCIFYILL